MIYFISVILKKGVIHSVFAVYLPGTDSRFYITKWLWQGCSLSPTLFKICIEKALENWQKKCAKMGLEIQDMTIHSMLFTTCARLWGFRIHDKEIKYMAIGDTSRYLQLDDRKEIISHANEYTYLVVRITKDWYHKPEINDRINRGQAAITKLNSILWDRHVTPKQRLIFIMQWLKVQLHMQQKHGV